MMEEEYETLHPSLAIEKNGFNHIADVKILVSSTKKIIGNSSTSSDISSKEKKVSSYEEEMKSSNDTNNIINYCDHSTMYHTEFLSSTYLGAVPIMGYPWKADAKASGVVDCVAFIPYDIAAEGKLLISSNKRNSESKGNTRRKNTISFDADEKTTASYDRNDDKRQEKKDSASKDEVKEVKEVKETPRMERKTEYK